MKDVLLYSGKFLFEKCLSYDFLMLPKTKNEAAFLKLRTQIFENLFFFFINISVDFPVSSFSFLFKQYLVIFTRQYFPNKTL